ncbi:hypothetical protein GN956_G4043 [Arapaima gigas]
MSTGILDSLHILTKPISEVCDGAAESTQSGALLVALRSNLAELEQRLHGEPRLREVPMLQGQVRRELEWYGNTEDPTWAFVQECLVLLLALTRHLTHLLESFRAERDPTLPRTAEAAPPLPPDVLSVAQQKTVSAALQFVITLGLCPYLLPGVGVALEYRSAFGATVAGAVKHHVAPPPDRRLLATTLALLEMSKVSSVATLVLTRHLGDVLAGLCQLGYCPERPEEGSAEFTKGVSREECMECRKTLQSLLGKVYQPIVIKELLILQGAPKQAHPAPTRAGAPRTSLAQAPPWLRQLCGRLLSERLMQLNGVQAVVRAVLEGVGAGGTRAEAATSDWRKCDAVARILAMCPQQSLSLESYYSQVCPQVLDLLHFRDKLTALQFQRVATSAALTMVQKQPEFGRRYLLDPLFAPLARCADSGGQDPSSVQEWELSRCIEDVYKVCVVANRPCPALLMSLEDILPVLFSLYCFTKQSVSHLRAPCQETLLWYLSHTEPPEAVTSLKRLCALSGSMSRVASGFEFTPGSEGGARLTPKATYSDEGDALYEKLSAEQWGVQCLVELLAEVKDSDLPGDFFLELLKELTNWVVEEEGEEEKEEQEEAGSPAATLLQMEERLWGRAEDRSRRLVLLQVLAAMCEGLSHRQLLRRPAQVVQFVEAMLQRAYMTLDRDSGGPVETQSLSMGMGLVATMLTGAVELSADDHSAMARLLEPLEHISKQHREPVIQELASDLRATLATRGAYCPDTVTQAAHRCKSQSSNRVQAAHGADPHKTVQSLPTDNSRTPHTDRPRNYGTLVSQKHPLEPKVAPGPSPSEPHDSESRKAFSECLLEAYDPDVPTRAAALRVLTRAVQQRDADALQLQEKVLMLFLENLDHDDSFVYLSAIQGLAVLADAFPERILQRLLEEYNAGPAEGTTQKARPLESRLKVGEVLMRASQAMGDLTPHYGRPLVGAFLRGTRDGDSSVRASNLSNLGELCQRLHFSLGPLVQELSSCLTALIKTEKEKEVRRAAVHVIALLLRGLSERATQVVGDVLLDLYRALKWVVRSDPDDVAVLHAQLALEELDDIMRRVIFPAQKLEKKIVVLP